MARDAGDFSSSEDNSAIKGTNVGIKYAQRRIDYVFTAKGIINAVHKYHCILSAPRS